MAPQTRRLVQMTIDAKDSPTRAKSAPDYLALEHCRRLPVALAAACRHRVRAVFRDGQSTSRRVCGAMVFRGN